MSDNSTDSTYAELTSRNLRSLRSYLPQNTEIVLSVDAPLVGRTLLRTMMDGCEVGDCIDPRLDGHDVMAIVLVG